MKHLTPIADILHDVADMFDLSVAAIVGPSRAAHIALARQVAAYVLYKRRPDLSLAAITRAIGRADHTTVIYARDKIAALRETNPEVDEVCRELLDEPPATPVVSTPATRPAWEVWWVTGGLGALAVLAA
jgi:chromosomal replication initiation ATPase DnaA